MNSFVETLNHWGSGFLSFLWPALWQSSLLITMVFVVELALRRKVRAAIRYALWLIVLVKLVLPPALALPTSAAWWLRASPQPAAKAPSVSYVVSYGDQTAPAFPVQLQPMPPPPRPKMSFAAWLLMASAGVSMALLAWLMVGWRHINQRARNARTAEQWIPIFDEARRLARSPAGIRLKLTEGTMSPAVCGLFRPVILLPQSLTEKLSAGQLRAVLLHEAIHLRRKDVWMNCAQALLQIVYWWHPLLWLANARIRRVREEAVDDAVMLALRDDADIYAPTLLEEAKFAFRRPLASLGLVGILESRGALRQRIERLINFDASKKAGLTVVSVLGILAFSAVALPMGHAPEKTNTEAISSPKSDLPSVATNATETGEAVQDGKLHYVFGGKSRQAPKLPGSPIVNPTSAGSPSNLVDSASRVETFRIDRPMKEKNLRNLLLNAGVKIPPAVLVYEDDASYVILLARGSEEQLGLIRREVFKLNGFSSKVNGTNQPTKMTASSPPANPTATNLEMRPFLVSDMFVAALRTTFGLQSNDVLTMAKSLFRKLDVDLTAPGRSIAYNDRLGLLFIKATPSELDTIQRTVQALYQFNPQIHLKARFMEVPKGEAEEVLKAGTTVEIGKTNKVEILTADQMKSLLRQLESTVGTETLAEPEAVTSGGRQTQMRATATVMVLTNFALEAAPSNTMATVAQTGKFETGPTVDLVSYVLADGYTINLAAKAELLELVGYDGVTNRDYATNRFGQRVPLPAARPGFRVQRAEALVNLWDHQTLVLGNMKSVFLLNGQIGKESKFLQEAEKKNRNADKELFVFITATIVDPAGNRVHSDDEIRQLQEKMKSDVPPQPKISSPSR